MPTFAYLVFLFILVIIFVDDLRFMRILDRVTIPSMIIVLSIQFWVDLVPLWSLLLGVFAFGGFFAFQYFISKGTWIGDGDIRLGVLMGLMLGFEQGLVALFLAYVGGAIVSLTLLAAGKADRKTQLPFGAFLCTATGVTLFFGQHLLTWYLGFFL